MHFHFFCGGNGGEGNLSKRIAFSPRDVSPGAERTEEGSLSWTGSSQQEVSQSVCTIPDKRPDLKSRLRDGQRAERTLSHCYTFIASFIDSNEMMKHENPYTWSTLEILTWGAFYRTIGFCQNVRTEGQFWFCITMHFYGSSSVWLRIGQNPSCFWIGLNNAFRFFFKNEVTALLLHL